MKIFRLDFNLENPCIDGSCVGRIGEHNATEIIITPPKALAENEAVTRYVVAFATGGTVIRSETIDKNKTISVRLWHQLTRNPVLGIQIEAYDDAGEYIGKSEYISGLNFLPSADGNDIPADTDNPDVVAQIIKMSKKSHSHTNQETIDKLSIAEDGNLLFDSKKIEGTSGVYIGSGEMPEGYNVQIDPEGEAVDLQITPLFANSIEECRDTGKVYVLPDGYIFAYKQVTEKVKDYENLADPTSDDWSEGQRFNSSGVLQEQEGFVTTNFIPIKQGDVVRIKGLDVNTHSYARVAFFNASKGVSSSSKISGIPSSMGTVETYDSTGGQFTVVTNDPYIRLCGEPTGEDIVITVNEEIKENTVTVEKWANTGHAFIPADYEDRIIGLENETGNHEERIVLLENSCSESEIVAVPAAWESAVNDCITTIKNNQNGRNCVTFAFFSDNHQRNGYAGLLIAKVMKECGIPYCFYGGDTISSAYISDEAEMIAQDKAFDNIISYIPEGRFCRAVGNHDGFWNDGTNKHCYTREQIYELFLREEGTSQNKHFGDDGTYYYIDDIVSKVRFIVLNTNGVNGSENIDGTQLSWLRNTALSVNQEGWEAVIISHHPISNHYHANVTNASEIISAVNGSDVKIIGWFSGHIHRDRMYTGVSVNDTDDTEGEPLGFTQITVTSDNTSIAYDDATKHTTDSGNKSHAVDFVTVNKNEKTVKITRLGIGNNREFSYA